jgi:hypothetical protein
MVFEEKLLPIYDHTHSHLNHGIWMENKEDMPLERKGVHLLEKIFKIHVAL